MALMIGALMMQGLAPGPQLMFQRPELFWGVIASMWVGNAMLVILNLPLIGMWVKLLSAPYRLLYPSILLFCCIGLYAIHNDAGDVLIGAVFGFLGYMFYRLNCELAPYQSDVPGHDCGSDYRHGRAGPAVAAPESVSGMSVMTPQEQSQQGWSKP
jgi:TctA family transporter